MFPALHNADQGDIDPSARSRAKHIAIEASTAVHKKSKSVLPKGGGPFKGFVYAVLPSRADAERVLETWKWEREVTPITVTTPVTFLPANMKSECIKCENMRAMSLCVSLSIFSFSPLFDLLSSDSLRCHELKEEYLAYRKAISVLNEAQESSRRVRQRDLDYRYELGDRSLTSQGESSRTLDRWDHDAHDPKPSSSRQGDRHRKRPSDDRHWSERRQDDIEQARSQRRRRTNPATLYVAEDEWDDIPSTGEASIQFEEFPKGCVCWVRGVNVKSTKGGLKHVFVTMLNELTSGKGDSSVGFVDYEKGLDTVNAPPPRQLGHSTNDW